MKSYRTPSDNYDVVTKGYVEEYVTNTMNNLKLCKITQSDYDSLESPDENTLYLIIDDEEDTTDENTAGATSNESTESDESEEDENDTE
jgi:hypothetical protein